MEQISQGLRATVDEETALPRAWFSSGSLIDAEEAPRMSALGTSGLSEQKEQMK